MNKEQLYSNLVTALLKQFGSRLKTIILFGSQSRGCLGICSPKKVSSQKSVVEPPGTQRELANHS